MWGNSWQHLEHYVSLAEQPIGFVDDSTSQPQQNYLPSAPVNLYWGSPLIFTQHQLMHNETSNDQVPTTADLRDAGQSPSDMTHLLLESEQRDIHSSTGQPSHNVSLNHPILSDSTPIEVHSHPDNDNQSESHGLGCMLICKWNNGRGSCDKTVNKGEIVGHVASCHLARRTKIVKCQWEGCTLSKPIRRDTLFRHIREIHLKINPRRKSRVASPSRSIANLHRSGQTAQPC